MPHAPFAIEAIVILPDHLHCLWHLPEDDADNATRWRHIKSTFSRCIPKNGGRSLRRERKAERGIWQRRYWEHLVTDGEDCRRHVDYIHINPVKHGYVARAVDWPHSSIHRFIERGDLPRDWGAIAMESELGKGHDDGYNSHSAVKSDVALNPSCLAKAKNRPESIPPRLPSVPNQFKRKSTPGPFQPFQEIP